MSCSGPATPETYALSLHDALPISMLIRRDDPRHALGLDLRRVITPGLRRQASVKSRSRGAGQGLASCDARPGVHRQADRKSTRLNSSHGYISYAVFCLKKRKTALW